MNGAWPRKAAFIKGVVQEFFMNSPPSYDFRTTPLILHYIGPEEFLDPGVLPFHYVESHSNAVDHDEVLLIAADFRMLL